MKHPLRWILLVMLFVLTTGAQKIFAVVRSTSASSDPDVNVRLRSWVDANFPGVLQDHTGQYDPKAPQLSTLIGDSENHNPTFTYLGQVKSRSGSGLDGSNTAVPGIGSIAANGGATIYSPKQGYELRGGYSYVILYASSNDIVIHDTAEDSVARGYTIHLFNINVSQKLLALYNQNESNGRPQLVAIPCHYNIGTVAGPDMRIIIRDTGNFMDIRYKDWWTQPVISNCKDIPAGLLTAAKKPPTGPIMDYSTGIEPKSLTDSRQIESGDIGAQGYQSIHGFESADFDKATQTDFAKEDNKMSEIFDPNTGGGELVPAALQEKVLYPNEQENYTGYKEVYASGKFFATIADKAYDCQDSRDAVQSTSPDPYVRTQAHYKNLTSILIPGPGKSSGLQWQAKQPPIVQETSGSAKLTLTDEYYARLKGCSEKVDSKSVPAVVTPIEGFFEALAKTIQSIVTRAWSALTDTVCDPDGKTNCHTVAKGHSTTLTVNKTASIILPGAPDIEKNAVGKQGALRAFFPTALISKLSKDIGFTSQTKGGSNNVLGDSTDSNCKDCIPHYQMHAVKYAFQKTSSCMLIPASIQAQRGTDCKLEGGGTAPTPPATIIPSLSCNAKNPGNTTAGPKNTYLSDGLIALAIKVSRYTCTPAEFIVGTIAGEVRGLNYTSVGAADQVIQGNPNESICRSDACLTNQTGYLGPYSWNSSLYLDQFNTWGALATDCFNALGVSGGAPDARSLGQATCTTAAKFWSSMHDNGNVVKSCTGAAQKSYNLSDIPADKQRLAYMHFCGTSDKCQGYWQKDQELIDAYKAAVARVKGEMAGCLR